MLQNANDLSGRAHMAEVGTNSVRALIVDDEELGRRYADHMTIRVRQRVFALGVSDISWIQGASQYSRVHTRNGEYLLSRTLAVLESELDPRRFFRIHRSAIVNAAHVSEVRSCGDGRYDICLRDGRALPMGRARREALAKLLVGISAPG
jgi:two-component system LytT family response regulator